MKISFTPEYNRKNRLNEQGTAPLEIKIYQQKHRKYISTGIHLKPDQWDKKNKKIKKHPEAQTLNIKLADKINQLRDIERKQILKGKEFSLSLIDDFRMGIRDGSFSEFMKAQIENSTDLQPSSKQTHLNTVNKLVAFKNNLDVSFSDINYSFVDRFINSLRNRGYSQNTVLKEVKHLKKYLGIAIKKGYYDQANPFKEFRIPVEKKKREVLTFDEIKKIEEIDLSKYDHKVSTVRDMFLFSCFTGLRISDTINLRCEYVKKVKEGYELDFVTIKVGKRAELPLHSLFKIDTQRVSKPEEILEKYFNQKNEFVFPRMTEQFINRHLKLISSLAGITVRLTFHTARHTFGTYMATKIPLPNLMYLMQHSDIKTTMIYVNMSQQLVKEGLMKVDWN